MTDKEKALDAASREVQRIQGARHERWSILEQEVHALEQKQLAILSSEFHAQEQTAQEAEESAQLAVDEERIANAGNDAKWPIGTRLVEWKGGGWASPKHPGINGVVEVFTKDSPRPGNLASYSIPTPGTLVIRHLKANGSPSLKFGTVGGDGYNWHLEGHDPNKKAKG